MLAGVRPDNNASLYDQAEFEAAVRFVFTDIWGILGDEAADRIVTPLLGDCWAGCLLARMKLHHEKRLQDQLQRLENENPERVRERREAKRELKKMRHAERLDRKQARDRGRQLKDAE